MSRKVRLVEVEWSTSVQIDVEITDEGDLLFSGYDLGDAPQLTYGDSDYEYWLRIAAVDKDRILLALIEKLYSGNPLVISKFKEYLDTKAIPNQFYSF